MALSVEASELEELYQWREELPSSEVRGNEELRARTREELADVLIYAMSMATQLDIDLLDAVDGKLDQNDERFDSDDVVDFE
jgi:NTP pyrophosphatase (non-canonical NTP hydrolase)